MAPQYGSVSCDFFDVEEDGTMRLFGKKINPDGVRRRNIQVGYARFQQEVEARCSAGNHYYLVVVDASYASRLLLDPGIRVTLRQDGDAEILNGTVRLFGKLVSLQIRALSERLYDNFYFCVGTQGDGRDGWHRNHLDHSH